MSSLPRDAWVLGWVTAALKRAQPDLSLKHENRLTQNHQSNNLYL